MVVAFQFFVEVYQIFFSERSCGENKVKCQDGIQCIPEQNLCDGWTRCNDKSDEEPAFCKGMLSYQNTEYLTIFSVTYH